jgi:hypothetical protein
MLGDHIFAMKSQVVDPVLCVSDDLVESEDEKICETWRFTISVCSCEYPKMSGKMVHNAENGFLRLLHFQRDTTKDGYACLNHLVRLTGDATWVSIVNLETEEQSKQWMRTLSPNEQETFTQTLPGLSES